MSDFFFSFETGPSETRNMNQITTKKTKPVAVFVFKEGLRIVNWAHTSNVKNEA